MCVHESRPHCFDILHFHLEIVSLKLYDSGDTMTMTCTGSNYDPLQTRSNDYETVIRIEKNYNFSNNTERVCIKRYKRRINLNHTLRKIEDTISKVAGSPPTPPPPTRPYISPNSRVHQSKVASQEGVMKNLSHSSPPTQTSPQASSSPHAHHLH